MSLRWNNVEVIPLIHGRLPFALAVRERMLSRRYAALAVELPPSLKSTVLTGIRLMPAVHAVVYHETALETIRLEEGEAQEDLLLWYVTLDPCDGIVESLRIAERDRTPIHFIDAEVQQFVGKSLHLPDPQALLTLGVEQYYDAVLQQIRTAHPHTDEDRIRERHMAARLRALASRIGNRGDVLFLCGMAHWQGIQRHLVKGTDQLHAGDPVQEDWVHLTRVHPDSLAMMLGEMPYVAEAYDRHRSGISLTRYDPIESAKDLLMEARDLYASRDDATREKASPSALRIMLDYTRKLTVSSKRLTPDLYSLIVAAKGVVGNDFALDVLEVARRYRPNLDEGDEEQETAAAGGPEGESTGEPGEQEVGFEPYADEDESPDETLVLQDNQGVQMIPRAPGEQREIKRIRLEERPPEIDKRRWQTAWNPATQCSWPPEDVIIENFRSYVTSRSLSMAGLDRVRTEEFMASMKDGLDLRETLRDLPSGKIHVKEEPRVPGRVGAVVVIFEEDDAGSKYPWRTTWMAEHQNESTLAFYATDHLEGVVGPGVSRARYGGCLFLFPPILIEDIWEDLRFEKARRPSERLLLAALYYSREQYVAHVSEKPPSAEVRATAERMGKHVVHLPLSAFSSRTLEKIRTVHVLNGHEVRSWAARFIR